MPRNFPIRLVWSHPILDLHMLYFYELSFLRICGELLEFSLRISTCTFLILLLKQGFSWHDVNRFLAVFMFDTGIFFSDFCTWNDNLEHNCFQWHQRLIRCFTKSWPCHQTLYPNCTRVNNYAGFHELQTRYLFDEWCTIEADSNDTVVMEIIN